MFHLHINSLLFWSHSPLSLQGFPRLQWPSDSTNTKPEWFSHKHQLMMMLILYSATQNR